MRTGVKLANARGVTCVHDKDGWLGAAGLWQRLEQQGSLTLRVWQSVPHDRLAGAAGALAAQRLRLAAPPPRLPEGVHGRDARLADGVDARRQRRADHERRAARADRARRRAQQAGRSACTRSATARTARRSTRSRRRATCGSRAASGSGSSTRSAWRRRTSPRFAELGVAVSVQFTHAPSDRDLAERFWADEARRRVRVPLARSTRARCVANGSDAPIEELDPWAGVVAGVTRTLDDRPPWRPEQALTLEQALHATCVTPAWLSHDERARGTLLPGRLADLVVLDRDPLALRARRAARGTGRRDDGRRALGAQPAALVTRLRREAALGNLQKRDLPTPSRTRDTRNTVFPSAREG